VTSSFEALFAEADTALDEAFATLLEIRPLAPAEFTRSSQLSSPAYRIMGILDLPTEVIRAEGRLVDAGAKSDIVAVKATADFALALFGADRPAPKEGDEIVAVERSGAPHYRVESAKPDGVSRLVCQLAPL
jgi:hypothetical protein